MGNPIISWLSNNCYIQALTTNGNNTITFCANNTVTDAQISCDPGTSGVTNTGNLNFYCQEAFFNCKISAGYAAYNRCFDTMYTQSKYDHRWCNS